MKQIIPERDLFFDLVRVQNPARYVGGEFGAIAPMYSDSRDAELLVALCFPDMYEIGMSNTAIKIIYDLLNRMEGVRCERVFLPAPEFETVLRNTGTPLFTLESGIPLSECDIVAFSIGYELSATNVLAVLELGGVPLHWKDRGNDDPVVIAGGPGVSGNPAPMGRFLDGVFIGEAEAGLVELARKARELIVSGNRKEVRKLVCDHPHVWHQTKSRPVRRAIWNEFGLHATTMNVPVPNMRVVQDHGVVEIMRGCPQGCRFCSAGVYYRPYRMKSNAAIFEEVDHLVDHCGYRYISLSSLSSGDYHDIHGLYGRLHDRYSAKGVSFALPSLRVNSLTLPLLEQVSRVRKSGLTFAVETASEAGQHALNKLVPLDRTIEILREAKSRGWRLAKFYFMIGLPIGEDNEAEQIIEFFGTITRAVKMNYNLAIATFIPKPHTPFQWAAQMSEERSFEVIRAIKYGLKPMGVKVGYQGPFHSLLEGVISRGTHETGELIEAAFKAGCRLDAWDEHQKTDVWRELFNLNGDLVEKAIEGPGLDQPLPWRTVKTGVTEAALRRELDRSTRGELTEQCAPDCAESCGICNRSVGVRDVSTIDAVVPATGDEPAVVVNALESAGDTVDVSTVPIPPVHQAAEAPKITYVVFSFQKKGPAMFLSHLALLAVFERSMARAAIPALFTSGFNPKPRFEFAQPLSLGIQSEDEIASVYVHESIHADDFCDRINRSLPYGFQVNGTVTAAYTVGAPKAGSLMSRFWGGLYRLDVTHADDRRLLLERMAEDALVDQVEAGGDGIVFRLQSHARAGAGVIKYLTAILGEHPFERGIRVGRLQSLARGESGDPVPFIDLASAQSASIRST